MPLTHERGGALQGVTGVVTNAGGARALTKADAEAPPLLTVLGSLASSGKGLLGWEPDSDLFKINPVLCHTPKCGSMRNPGERETRADTHSVTVDSSYDWLLDPGEMVPLAQEPSGVTVLEPMVLHLLDVGSSWWK